MQYISFAIALLLLSSASLYAGDLPWLRKFGTMEPLSSGETPQPEIQDLPMNEANGMLFRSLLDMPATGEYTLYVTSDGPNISWICSGQIVDGDFGRRAEGATA